MIDHGSRCIFIHQRKVAGCSIMSAFGKDESMRDWHRYNGGTLGTEWANRAAPEDSYFVFSAVRNPFDRLISGWKYLPSLRSLPLEQILRNMPKEGHDYRHIAQPQIAMLRDQATGKIVVDDLIRFETLQLDFDRICDRIGKKREILKLENNSVREENYRSYYNREMRAIVEDLFSEDLKAFGYEF